MSDPLDDAAAGFAPPPFRSDAALLQLRRALRDLKLTGRGDGFEMRGKRFAELTLDGDALEAGMVRKPALTPEWDRSRIASATDSRKWLDEFKRRLLGWQRED